MPTTPVAPQVEPSVCGDRVCFSPEDTVELADYVHQLQEVEIAVERCALIKREES